MGSLLCPLSENEAQTTRVFWSNHLTNGHEEQRRKWLSPLREADAEIKFSYPPFNNKLGLDFPASVVTIDAPAFGPNIGNAVMAVFQSDEMRSIASSLGITIPSYSLDKMVQGKMSKVRDMIKYCDETWEIGMTSNAATRKLQKFVEEFEALSEADIKSVSDWEAFVGKHAKPGWQAKLHFDHLLSNFGFEETASNTIRRAHFTTADGEVIDFEQYALRWLCKAFSGYGPSGALVDVVNLVFALTQDSYHGLDDIQIAEKIGAVARLCAGEGCTASLWIPTHIFIDAELDDTLVWVLAECLCKRENKKLRVLIQLPPDTDFDELAAKWMKIPGCDVWRDPDACNAPALRKTYC